MSAKTSILIFLETHSSATGRELCEYLGISRQALNVHLRALIGTGEVVKSGSTRGARYYATKQAPKEAIFKRKFELQGLDESEVYSRAATMLNLRTALRPNVESIAHYAFTEMLNNAIDHSQTDGCGVDLRLQTGSVFFEIRDDGIGVFHSIAAKFNLEDEHAAMIELIKGKTTTMPAAHTGEGIFFTSRVADRFVLRSHRIQVEWDRSREDLFVSEPRLRKGTTVQFQIRRDTRTQLENVFAKFAPEEYDYQFEITRVQVKLLNAEYISRSEAKRLIANLDKFRAVELDFRDVKTLGQGFADEVFRVFASQHPDIRMHPINTSAVIEAMIRHVRTPKKRTV